MTTIKLGDNEVVDFTKSADVSKTSLTQPVLETCLQETLKEDNVPPKDDEVTNCNGSPEPMIISSCWRPYPVVGDPPPGQVPYIGDPVEPPYPFYPFQLPTPQTIPQDQFTQTIQSDRTSFPGMGRDFEICCKETILDRVHARLESYEAIADKSAEIRAWISALRWFEQVVQQGSC